MEGFILEEEVRRMRRMKKMNRKKRLMGKRDGWMKVGMFAVRFDSVLRIKVIRTAR